MTKPISTLIDKYGMIVRSLSITEISEAFRDYGYTDDVVNNINKQYDDAKLAIINQSKESINRHILSKEFSDYRDEIDSEYRTDIKICRFAFANREDLLKIIPGYLRIYPYSTWYKTINILYHNLLNIEGALDKLSRFKYTAERIKERLDKLQKLPEMASLKIQAKCSAEEATVYRNRMVKELSVTCNEITVIGKSIFGKNAQILEKMGITAKSK